MCMRMHTDMYVYSLRLQFTLFMTYLFKSDSYIIIIFLDDRANFSGM